MPGCAGCGFALLEVEPDRAGAPYPWRYDETHFGSSAESITTACEGIAEILRSDPEDLRTRARPDRWSQLEYACHVRDVLLVQRERVLKALRGHGDEVLPMGRDERVEHDAYNQQHPGNVALQVEQAALLFTDLLHRLSTSEWDLEVAYLFPEPSLRTVRWVAVHTAHEVVHHRHDMDPTVGAEPAPTEGGDQPHG